MNYLMHLDLLLKFALKALIVGAAFNNVRQSTTRQVVCGIDTAAMCFGFAAKAAPTSGKIIVVFNANQN